MESSSGRRARLAVRLVAALSPLALLSACVPDQPAPVAPATPLESASAGTPSAPATSTSSAPSTPATPVRRPSGLPTHPVPAEPACALPADLPAAIPGADGPTLTVERVKRAWQASEAGKANKVSTGRVKAGDNGSSVTPVTVLFEPGTPWVSVDYFEWYGLRTLVFEDAERAAAKLAAIRQMLKEPCSYPFGYAGPYVVARLATDQPDQLTVTGVMEEKVPVGDWIVRYGNTVTVFDVVMMVPPDDEVVSVILDAMRGA